MDSKASKNLPAKDLRQSITFSKMQHQRQAVYPIKHLSQKHTGAQSSAPSETKNAYGGQFG